MKKLWALLLALLLVFSIVGCNSNQIKQPQESTAEETEPQTIPEETLTKQPESSDTED